MKYFKSALLIVILSVVSCFASSPHNLLPRFPQLVFDKGTTDMFCVEELIAYADMQAYTAQTELSVKLKNVSEKQINLPIKIRVLYPTGKKSVSILVNNKTKEYKQENPTIDLSLAPNETTNISIKAHVSTDYSVNNIKKAIVAQENQKKSKLQTFGESFARYFNQEVYGKRFIVGTLVSKWGIFPVDIKKSKIEVNASNDIVLISENSGIWKETSRKKGKKFICEATEGFETAVFLPEKDIEAFKENQQLIKQINKK